MAKTIVKLGTPIKLADLWTKKDMQRAASDWWDIQIKRLKEGKIIRKKYAASTIAKRKRYGLQTKFVDLFGSTRYSKKQWRLTAQGVAKATSNKRAVIEWKRKDAETLYGYHIRRYGKIF